eukprot:361262-Chlamydomonas_euryale.AAC.5
MLRPRQMGDAAMWRMWGRSCGKVVHRLSGACATRHEGLTHRAPARHASPVPRLPPLFFFLLLTSCQGRSKEGYIFAASKRGLVNESVGVGGPPSWRRRRRRRALQLGDHAWGVGDPWIERSCRKLTRLEQFPHLHARTWRRAAVRTKATAPRRHATPIASSSLSSSH